MASEIFTLSQLTADHSQRILRLIMPLSPSRVAVFLFLGAAKNLRKDGY